jgi:stage V sporulation protein D (sporulation-specific penicillin-binding protein)
MQIGQRLGLERFYDYFEAFGLTDSTGIDLPGESTPKAGISYWRRQDMTGVDLAVASFGQRFEVTPIQMAMTAA